MRGGGLFGALVGLLVGAVVARAETLPDGVQLAHSGLRPFFESEVKLTHRLVATSASLAPFGHVRFCLTHPASCQPSEAGTVLPEVTAARIAELRQVNGQINARIRPRSKGHLATLGGVWEINPPFGDCNDYAVSKREELLRRGWPARALLLTAVMTPQGEGHLVLVVRMRGHDFVLDNLSPAVRDWREPDYSWRIMQSETDPQKWVTVDFGLVPERDVVPPDAWLENDDRPGLRGIL